jgi:hypothetical protein
MVTCEASGAREHGHDPKHEASSGRTNNARKGVDASIWAVLTVNSCIKVHLDLKADKSPIIVKGPFFP